MEPKNQAEAKLKNKTLYHFDGPLLFTAPHSKKLYRGGPLTGDKQRVHLRELFTSFLAVDFALKSSKMMGFDKQRTNSYCIWGSSKVLDEQDLDPNYLHPKQYEDSPFHQSLHAFQMQNNKMPLFHIDIHGKYDRKENCQLDVGLACMDYFWHQPQLVLGLKKHLTAAYNSLFKGMKVGNYEPKCNCEPYLHGLWGDERIATMTEQAIKLQIPSLQLEIPRKMRDLLFSDIKFREKFLQILLSAYKDVVCPWWIANNWKTSFTKEIGSRLPSMNYTIKEVEQLYQQLQQKENKAKLDLNAKII